MNYMIKGIQALKESVFLGIIIYIVIFVLLYLFKKRRTISWNYMFEGIFCIYCVTLLNLTGIFTLSYSLNGPFNYNLLPFIGSSIKFENAENFSIERADRLLYNADKNVLYWGEAGYQNCLDYTKMNEEMQAHKEEILKGYEELSTSIRDCFNQ